MPSNSSEPTGGTLLTIFTIDTPAESNLAAPADMTVELTDAELEVLSGGRGKTGGGEGVGNGDGRGDGSGSGRRPGGRWPYGQR